MLARIPLLLSLVSTCLIVSGCGDDLTAQAKRAAEEVAAEAKKTAASKIDEVKNATVEQLKQLGGAQEEGSDSAAESDKREKNKEE